MKKNFFYFPLFLLIFGFGIFLTSCTTQRSVQFEVLTPPSNALPKSIRTVVLVNQAIKPVSDSSGTNFAFQQKLYYDTTKVDTMLSMLVLDGLAGMLSAGERYQLIPKPMVLPKTDAQMGNPLLVKRILSDSLKRIRADAAIVLDDVKTFDWLFYKGENPGPVYIMMEAYTASFWKIYRLSDFTLLDEFALLDTNTWQVSRFSFEAGFSSIPNRIDALAEGAFNSGERAGRRLSPYSVKVNRSFYVDSDSRMKEAEQWTNQSLWLTAAKIWNEVAAGKNRKRASMAAYNMALASEIQGNLEMAVYWIEKAMELKSDVNYSNYRYILNRRVSDAEILKEQLSHP